MSYIYLEFQDQKLPCHHIIVVCKEQILDPENYTSQLYLVNTYCNIYLDNYAFDPIRIEDLKLLSHCHTLFIQRKDGHP